MSESQRGPVTVHMIGNAHIDPVWLWPLQEGREEVLSTYRTAIALLEEFEGYVFTAGGSATYAWVAEDDPALFAAIQRAVASGRWALVNGWWIQPDCNIPGGEAFLRHTLYGQRYLQEAFGRRARVGYNVDSFGHAGTLPQLLRLGGLDYYLFFRPGPHEMDLPVGPFWWEAPDGTRVLTCRPPLHYGTPEAENLRERVPQAVARGAQALPVTLCFYGVGNHGGGPTRRNVQTLVEMMAEGGEIRPRFSSPDAYFAEVEALGREWPVVRQELQHHARGCYTALSRIKRENRFAEHALMRAERLQALARVFASAPAAQGALREAWQGVLLNQFHDILAGTSIKSAYEDVWRLYEAAFRTAERLKAQAVEALSARVRVEDRDQPLLVWNPLAWERTETVRLRVPMGGFRSDRQGLLYPTAPRVVDDEGRAVPCQIVDVALDYAAYVVHLDARVTLPALGCRALYAAFDTTTPPERDPVPPAADSLENEHLCLRVDPATGYLTSLTDREGGVEFLGGPAGVGLVIDDPSDTWSHGVPAFPDVIGRLAASAPPVLLHEGPAQRTLRVQSAWGASTLTLDYTLPTGARYVDVTLTVDWHERLKMLKLAFPLAVQDARVRAAAPYGSVERAPNGEEEPCQAWVDLTGRQSGRTLGLAVLNDSKYAYSAEGSELRLSVLRSPIYAFHEPRQIVPGVTYHYTDQGTQVVRYRLVPHVGPWEAADLDREALALQEPPIVRLAAPRAEGRAPGALLSVSPANMVLTVLKVPEEGEGEGAYLIARGFESQGRGGELVLHSPALGREWRHRVHPFEVWTLALPLDGGAPRPLNALEEAL